GALVALKCKNGAASAPDSVTIPPGQLKATFQITTTAVTSSTAGTVSATYAGVARSSNLTVRPISVKSVALKPAIVKGGTSSVGPVTLEAPAAPGAITVTFSSSNSTVASPSPTSINIPAGQTTGHFTVNTTTVGAQTKVTITATANGLAKSKV